MNGCVPQLASLDFEQLATTFREHIESCDIVALNWIAAAGLPGTDTVDFSSALETLDSWATQVRINILRHMVRFNSRSQEPPSEFSYGNSLPRFLCYFLLQVLQEDCNVRYNPDRKFNPNFCTPPDLFVHGILDPNGAGGTCASMPVVYVSVGRRLGFPLKLVEGKHHVFFRWDDPLGTVIHWEGLGECRIPPDRFNVEGTGEGFAFHSDAHYIQWPELWTEQDFAHGRYLRSHTPREEFASFLINRGECLWELGRHVEALKAFQCATQLVPEDERYQKLYGASAFHYEQQQLHEIERIMEINERNRKAIAFRNARMTSVPGRVVKIAFGRPIPPHLPPGTPVRCVPADEADPVPVTAKPWAAPPSSGGFRPVDQLTQMSFEGSASQCAGFEYVESPTEQSQRIREQNQYLMTLDETRRALLPFSGRTPRPLRDLTE
jgi:tetratricopeptide (TPR) repeat protein